MVPALRMATGLRLLAAPACVWAGEFQSVASIRAAALSTLDPTVEGEATAHYIAQLLHSKRLIASRIAHGVPLGGELELVDGGTLAHSFAGRKPIAL